MPPFPHLEDGVNIPTLQEPDDEMMDGSDYAVPQLLELSSLPLLQSRAVGQSCGRVGARATLHVPSSPSCQTGSLWVGHMGRPALVTADDGCVFTSQTRGRPGRPCAPGSPQKLLMGVAQLGYLI